MLKWRISSLLGLANVTFRVLAFAAQAIFNNLQISDKINMYYSQKKKKKMVIPSLTLTIMI